VPVTQLLLLLHISNVCYRAVNSTSAGKLYLFHLSFKKHTLLIAFIGFSGNLQFLASFYFLGCNNSCTVYTVELCADEYFT